MKKNRLILLLSLALSLLLCACAAETPAPPSAPEAAPLYALTISELMAANKAAVCIDGDFPDWVELRNGGETAIPLGDCWLRCGKKYMPLPDEALAPGAYALIPCGQMHLPKEGAELALLNRDGVELDRVVYENAPTDESLVRAGNALSACRWPSPGEENGPAGYARWQDTLSGGELVIQEVMVYNDRYLPVGGETFDWVELKNVSDRALTLANYSLADSAAEIGRWPLPDRTLQPGELCTLLCGAEEGGVPFALASGGEELYLARTDGTLCDFVSLHDIPLGGSMGRMAGAGGFFYFAEPSPGGENSGGVRRVSARPEADTPGGVLEGVEQVRVTLSAPGEIRYTLDGSLPTREAALYTEPLVFEKTGVLRAVCFEDDALPGAPLDLSLFLNEGHALPVVSVIAAPEDLFSLKSGIYSNPEEDWEVPASAALFAQERGFDTIQCGLKMHGAKSRVNQAKKSFKLCFRARYEGELDCDLFENGITTYSSVLLRAAWESTISTQMRDILMHELGKACSDSLPTQDYRYCALYLNGEYWGLYALREAHSQEHYARHFGFDADSVVMSQGDWPSGEEAAELWEFLMANDLRRDEAYDWVRQRLDVESVIAWSIIQSYSGNIDMHSPNMRFYRSDEDGLIRYVLVDLDLGFFNFGEANLSLRTGNPYSTAIIRLMDNASFRALYLQRLSEYLHGPLSDENFLALAHRLAGESFSEVERDYRRWGKTPSEWQHEMDTYIYGSTAYPGGHAGMLAQSARSVFRMTDEEWEALFPDF